MSKLAAGKVALFTGFFYKSSYSLLETSDNFSMVPIEFVVVNYPRNRIVLLDIKLSIAVRAFGSNLNQFTPKDYMSLGTLGS